jgi:hypothetical protein
VYPLDHLIERGTTGLLCRATFPNGICNLQVKPFSQPLHFTDLILNGRYLAVVTFSGFSGI